ncbi:TetR/AcrR family transcriptional regulator [Nocardioides sp.]|uniref:TetR/AcrR family transcriptional regulator n=1 Tax=Nocardioides sp. TaxID=35761 RepID=UPI0035175A1A
MDDAPPPLKQRLLDAALEALRELDTAALLNAVGVREIARRAGASPASIYHHYGSLQGLADAVLGHVYEPRTAPIEGLLEQIALMKYSQLPLTTALEVHGSELDRLTDDVDYPLRVGLWAFGGAQGAAAYRHYLRTIDDHLGALAKALFDSWSRTLRPPFEIEHYMAMRVALVNGSVLRHRIEPEALTRHHYQRAATALDLVLLRVDGDRHDTDGRLAEINYYPLGATTARVPTTARGLAANARILNAAAGLFNTLGYEHTTYDHIASRSNTSVSTLKRYYPSKHDLAVALFIQHARDELLTDPQPQWASLLGHLTALARLVPPRAAEATAYLTEVLTTPHHTDELVQHVCSLLVEARERADPDAPADEHAETSRLLITLTIRRALHEPAGDPSDHAAAVLGLLAPQHLPT